MAQAGKDTIKVWGSQSGTTYPAVTGRELAWSEALPGQLIIGNVSDNGSTYDIIGRRVTKAAGTPNGNVTPLKEGEIYINSSTNDVFVAYGTTNTQWSQVNGAGTGDLLAANNLNDVASSTTSIENLVGSATLTAAVGGPAATDKILIQDASATDALRTLNFSDFSTVSTLPDLTDVVSATNTGGFVLVANGTTGYVGRALLESDISDFGTYLTAEVNDLTSAVTWTNVPNANITEASVTQHTAAVVTTSAVTAAGALMDSEVTAANLTTFTAPASTTISAYGATLVDDADATAARTTLGLGALATLASVDTAQIAASAVTETELDAGVVAKLNNTLPSKLDGTTAPGATNDINDAANASDGVGFVVGSLWVDTTASPREAYRCVDNTDGAAVWVNTSLETSELGTLALQNTVGTSDIDGDAVTYEKMQNVVADDVLLGNIAGAGGIVAEITPAQVLAMIGPSPTANYMVRVNGTGDGLVYQDGVDGGTWT